MGEGTVGRRLAMVFLAGALVVALTACAPTSTGHRGAPFTYRPVQSPCHVDGDREDTVKLSGGTIFGVGVGTGPRVVLVVPDRHEDHCDWMPLAREVARDRRLQVWVMDPATGEGGLSSPGTLSEFDCAKDVERGMGLPVDGGSEVVVVGSGSGVQAGLTQAAESSSVLGVVGISPAPCMPGDRIVPEGGVVAPVAVIYGKQDAARARVAEDVAGAVGDQLIGSNGLPTATQQADLVRWERRRTNLLALAITEFALTAWSEELPPDDQPSPDEPEQPGDDGPDGDEGVTAWGPGPQLPTSRAAGRSGTTT